MSSVISEVLIKLVKETGIQFSLDGEPLDNDTALSDDAALPLFAFYAESLRAEALGGKTDLKLGANIDPNNAGMFGLTVSFDSQIAESVQILLISNAIIEYVNTQVVGKDIKSFDDIKNHVNTQRALKGYLDTDLIVIPMDLLPAVASFVITPEVSLQKTLNNVKV